MTRAVALGEHGRRSAPPNPWVGCVVVRDGDVVGEGFHVRPGQPHAEAVALAAAGASARGATVVVTLEPCTHHGRTSPCADALIAAGVARVVVALEDPDPRVQGTGIERLRDAGLEVEVGVGAAEAAASLASYLHHRRTGRALCLAKVASTLDGRIAAADGTSQWITGEAAREDAHDLRAECQAIVVGSGTALADHPALTVRGVEDAPVTPLRVLLDGRGRVPADGPLFDPSLGPTLVFTSERAPTDRVDAWRAAGAKVETLPAGADGSGVDLESVLSVLGGEGVLQAMFEGGAHVHGALQAAGLADRLVAYVAPTLLGTAATPAFAWHGPATLAAAARWRIERISPIGADVRLDLVRVARDGGT